MCINILLILIKGPNFELENVKSFAVVQGRIFESGCSLGIPLEELVLNAQTKN